MAHSAAASRSAGAASCSAPRPAVANPALHALRPAHAGSLHVCRADKGSGGGGGGGVISEDVLARLRAAEDEAARLRKELAAAQAGSAAKAGAVGGDVIEDKPKRIDSTDRRETLNFTSERSTSGEHSTSAQRSTRRMA